MAAPGGKSGGRVSIRVIPDATKFRNDLKLLLKRVEQSMSANLMVEADTAKAAADLRRFQKDWNGKKVDLTAGVNTLGASAHLRVFSRPRVIPVLVKVSKASLVKASTIIASLAGARVAGDLVENLVRNLQNLDRALPKITAVALAVGSIGALAFASVGGVFTLGEGLGKILGIGVALPGILAGFGVGIGTLVLALTDTTKQLGFLKPRFVDLKNVVSENFWAKARKPIIDLVNTTLPSFRAGLGATSSAVGEWARSVVGSFQRALGGGVLDRLFVHLVESIRIATGGADAFVQSIVTLGGVGGAYLPRLAQWVSDFAVRFNNFMTDAAADGRLVAVIDAGIAAAKQLGSALGSLVKIWGGISEAATAAGGGGLASFADVLSRVADIVNSPQFQTTMKTLFQGAAVGAAGLSAALGPIGDMFSALAPVISGILGSSGTVVGEILGQIAKVLSDPVFSEGLGQFFAGLQSGLLAVAPSLPAVAAALGTFLSFAGKLAAQLGPVLGATLEALAPLVVELLDAITPLLPMLGTLLVGAIKAIAPLLLTVATALLPPLVALFSALIPVIMPLIQAILPIISALLLPIVAIVNALLPILTPILALLKPIIDLLSAVLVPVLDALTPIISFLGDSITFVANIVSGVLGTAIQLLIGLLSGDMGAALVNIGKIWIDVWNNIQDSFKHTWDGIVEIAKGAFNGLSSFITGIMNGIIDLINGVIGGIQGLAGGLKDLTGGAIDIKLAKLPHLKAPKLALGADVLPSRGGTMVTLGEGGKRETVVNYGGMNKLLQLTSRLAHRVLRVGTGGDVTIPVYGAPGEDPRLIARAVGREFTDLMAGE